MIYTEDKTIKLLGDRQIGGWMMESECRWLYNRAMRANTILEIGCWKGRSTFCLCAATPGVVFSVDHWQGSDDLFKSGHGGEVQTVEGRKELIALAKYNLREFLNTNLFIMECTSYMAMLVSLPHIVKHRGFDLIFLDGGHSYEQVQTEISWAKTLIASEGIICGHDYKPGETGVPQAVDKHFPQRKIAQHTSIWYASSQPKGSAVHG